ncbi:MULTISPECIES: DUF6400 family protein [Streptomyces]|uniref:DUF6400 family protein n=1 Tax=Streptomyces TaxID=1883 RepID=UPI00093B0A54|nr:DUF6400 family protein [Streptomyces sp. MJM1172]OKI50508.1 hypothetical protein AMK15_32255 [Streptomyces sp. MJM1172]
MAPSPTPPTGPDGAGRPGSPELVDFTVDLTAQEALRQAQVLAAIGPDWDPIEVLRGEEAAYDLLYSGLDADQQRLYDDLVAAGVLPRRGGGRAAA